MSSNYEKNKSKIINDYYKLIGAFYNCKLIYDNKSSFEINENDSEDEKNIKIGRQEDLLSELGKVGEKLFKYILGLEYLKIYPNSDEQSFEGFFTKSNILKEFIKKHDISENDERLVKIMNYDDANNQKAHNYDYWFSVIELTMPECFKKIQRFLIYLEQSDIFLQYCIDYNQFYHPYSYYDEETNRFYSDSRTVSMEFDFAIFPDYCAASDHAARLTKKQSQLLLTANREAIRISGDAFTRFRYASNNLDNKMVSVDDTYKIISKLVTFTIMIHASNDDLDFDLNIAYTRYKALELCKYVDISEEEINRKLDLNLGYTQYLTLLFDKNYSAKEIEKLLALGIDKNRLWKVTDLNIFARDIEYSKTLGITDIDEIFEMKQKFIEEGKTSKI